MSTFFVIWILCGIVAICIVSYMDYQENGIIEIRLKHVIPYLTGIAFGCVTLGIMMVGLVIDFLEENYPHGIGNIKLFSIRKNQDQG